MNSSGRQDELVYGSDEKTKAKGSSRSKASAPGVVAVNDNSDDVLFGKEKAKSESISRDSRSKKGSRSRSRSSKDRGDSDKSSSRSRRHRHGSRRHSSGRSPNKAKSTSRSKAEVLYGNDEDAKAKAKASRGNSKPAHKPGVERIDTSGAAKPGDKGYVADPLFAENKKESSKESVQPILFDGVMVARNGNPRNQQGKKQKSSNKNNKKTWHKKCFYLFCFILLCGGAGFAVYHFTKDKDPKESLKESLEGETAAPDEGICQAIAKGNRIEGLEEMVVKSFAVTMEASVTSALANVWLQDLQQAVQERLMPVLVGCPVHDGESRRALRSHDNASFRELQGLAPSSVRFCLLDDDHTTAGLLEGGTNSYTIEMKVDLYVINKNQDNAELEKLIGRVFRSQDPLSDYLGMQNKINEIGLMEVVNYVPISEQPSLSLTEAPSLILTENPTPSSTDIPTMSLLPSFPGHTLPPTGQPSGSPSQGPSIQPTPLPTPGPTPTPTPSPTFAPVPGVTPAPTPSPTPGPTPSPTPAPTPLPTPGPTPSPTPAPTPLPTPGPTLNPTPAPTPLPTPGPSLEPSVMPSIMASTSPSIMASTSPSTAPTLHRTKPPSTSPSTAPTLPSTPTPTFTGSCDENGSCGTSLITGSAVAAQSSQRPDFLGICCAASLSIDGRFNTFGHNANDSVDPWWQVDLGLVGKVTKVILWSQNGAAFGGNTGAFIELLDSGGIPKTSSIITMGSTTTKSQTFYYPGGISGIQYVRIRHVGSNKWIRLSEVQVSGFVE